MNIITHYDKLIDENNDPFRDPPILQEYMNKWDGQLFIDSMKLDKTKSVLEIGVGTGRIAAKTAPDCLKFTGIDISPKTIARAEENLIDHKNIQLICSDFSEYIFSETFDVIYSSLTIMHFRNKQEIISKVDSLLNINGIFSLSIDKNHSTYIDTGTNKIEIYPDTLDNIISYINKTDMKVKNIYETEFAHIIVCAKA